MIASRDAGYQTTATADGVFGGKNENPLQLKRIRPNGAVGGLEGNLEYAFGEGAV
jgi:hypothetical protein